MEHPQRPVATVSNPPIMVPFFSLVEPGGGVLVLNTERIRRPVTPSFSFSSGEKPKVPAVGHKDVREYS